MMVANQIQPTQSQAKPQSKPWWQSKTIGFNSLVMAATVITAAIPSLHQYMSEENYAVLVAGVTFANTVLRLFTHQAIANTEADIDINSDIDVSDTGGE